ncbi:type IV pilus twitching motility protein PilT [Puniceicoccus vermicola]|uniref:PilT/PilU family type 4a pilus ATPase n=1 Tax=Puniceicoccus vermicola TaxID=388746 RepID=A0A7X1AYU1_9BACT|nr:PilT/PilU family type 4a pilus ATPase [Puniceicoccus vermicola]MBC2602483.1 PilT/PilU family type 4a pilus ATPase [Puniceicoccus vermicola]
MASTDTLDFSDALDSIHRILALAVEKGASDIHLKSNKIPIIRQRGALIELEGQSPLRPEIIQVFIEQTTQGVFRDQWEQEFQVDYAYRLEDVGRFRVNGFMQRTLPGMVFRLVNENPPSLEDLNHDPELFRKLCKLKDGIILVCGATGSGKSSTLAAMINLINREENKHIVTLEDPIEYTYTDDKSLINQREIGIDIQSFDSGLRAVLRQDPDIILIGEMRDRSTFETALRAAETGHLVLSTLHAAHSQQAIRRLFEFFPSDQQEIMKRQISEAVRCTIIQKLLPDLKGDGRMPAKEVMMVDPSVRKLIELGQFEKLFSAIEAGKENGSHTFNWDLYQLVKAGSISKETALAFSPNPKQLEMNLKGIFLSSGGLVS